MFSLFTLYSHLSVHFHNVNCTLPISSNRILCGHGFSSNRNSYISAIDFLPLSRWPISHYSCDKRMLFLYIVGLLWEDLVGKGLVCCKHGYLCYTIMLLFYNPGQKCWNTFRPIFEIAPSPPGSMLKHDFRSRGVGMGQHCLVG